MFGIIIGIVSGFLLSIAFPHAAIYPLAWISLAPVLYLTYRMPWWKSIVCGLAFGFIFFFSLLYWIGIYGYLPWFAAALYEALFVVAFVVAVKLIGSGLGYWGRLLLAPALWVVLEWLRSLGMFGFTWGDLGYSQYKALSVIQISSLGGVWAVSFMIVLVNAGIANLLLARHSERSVRAALPQALAVLVAFAGVLAYGNVSLHSSMERSGKAIRAAIIQGNISQNMDNYYEYEQSTWKIYGALTRTAAKRSVDLVVWPETVIPGNLGRDEYPRQTVREIADSTNACMLVGGLDQQGGKEYNTAFLVLPLIGVCAQYSKVHLVPFGEFVPARKYLPFLRYYRVRPTDTSPGNRYNVLDAGGYKIGTAICFESVFPDIARRLCASGGNVLCVITDDEWFGKTAAAEQHAYKSVFRAVENRRYLLQGAATGISMIIDPAGRVLDDARLGSTGILIRNVWPQSRRTLYTRLGDWLVYCSMLLSAVFAVYVYRRRPRRPEVEQGRGERN